MPTILGLFFVFAGTFAFAKRRDYLLPLLIFSGIFQGGAIFSSQSFGLQPYYVIAALFVLRSTLDNRGQLYFRGGMSGQFALAAFGLVAVSSAFILPLVFAGTPVYKPSEGIDAGFLASSPLSFGTTNVGQAGFLAINVCVVLAAQRAGFSAPLLQRSFLFTFYFLVTIVGIQFLCLQGGIPFPRELLNNNGSYSVVDMDAILRPMGTFSEPSFCGATLASFAVGFLIQHIRHRGSLFRVAMAVFALMIVASSSSLLALGIAVFAAIIAHPILRFPWFVRIDRLRKMSVFLVLGILVAVALAVPAFRDLLIQQTVEKGDSWSYLVRTNADLDALQIASSTHWIGVGIGSNRPSSLAAALVSNTGALGLVTFFLMFAKVLRNAKACLSWIPWAALTLLLCMCFGIPDVTFPEMWVLLAMSAAGGSHLTAHEGSWPTRLLPRTGGPENRPSLLGTS